MVAANIGEARFDSRDNGLIHARLDAPYHRKPRYLRPARYNGKLPIMTEADRTGERGQDFGFAEALDVPIPYLARVRDYYSALGYGAPYQWAHYAKVPFSRLTKPLDECRITLITTAAPYQPDKGDQGPGG